MIAAALCSEELLGQLSPLVPQLQPMPEEPARLIRSLAGVGPDVLIVPAADKGGWPTAPLLIHLRELFPRLPIVVYAELPADRRHMAPLRCVSRVAVVSNLEDLPELLTSMAADPARRQQIIRAALALLPDDSLRRVCRTLLSALPSAGERVIAGRLGISQRTLQGHRRKYAWPTLRALGALTRTLVAAAHADLPPSVRAGAAGYRSTSAMRRARHFAIGLLGKHPHLHFGAALERAEELAMGGSKGE